MEGTHAQVQGAGQATHVLEVDLEALYASLRHDKDAGQGVTANELRKATGWSGNKTSNFILAMIEAGRCRVGRKNLLDRCGRRASVPCYIFDEQ